MKAIWKGQTIADSHRTIEVEGNRYFPVEDVNKDLLQPSSTHTSCPWKGEASYYNIKVNGDTNKDAAWYYPQPKDAAQHIKNHIAFWKGVEIEP